MASQFETGAYTNRGFINVDPNGFAERFTNWLGRSAANNGAGWTLIDDQHIAVFSTFTVPDYTNNKLLCTGHSFVTGQDIYLTTNGTLPGGLLTTTLYRVIYVDSNNIKLANMLADALAGTAVSLTSAAGSGMHTVSSCPYKVYCNVPSPVVNQVACFFKISIAATITPYNLGIRIMQCLWWDVANHIPRGIWSQIYQTCETSNSNYYYFNGNTDFISIISTTGNISYYQHSFGKWVGASALVEDPSLTGTLMSGITAGVSVVMQLNTGQAANFTVGNWYFIYDFNGHSWVDYVKVIARDMGLDTITIQLVNYNFPSGAVLGAYPHRFYSFGTGLLQSTYSVGIADNTNYTGSTTWGNSVIPYTASTSGVPAKIFHRQDSQIQSRCGVSFYYNNIIVNGNPTVDNVYYVQAPIIYENLRGDGAGQDTPRIYGMIAPGNLYFMSSANVSIGNTQRLINGKRYRAFGGSSSLCYAPTGTHYPFIPMESV